LIISPKKKSTHGDKKQDCTNTQKNAPRLDMIDAQYCITVADLRYSFDYGVEY